MYLILRFFKKTTFHRILEDHSYLENSNLIELKKDKKIKVVMCSGKIYFDLIEAREKVQDDETVFIRIEQLYPFPVKHLGKIPKDINGQNFFGVRKNQ